MSIDPTILDALLQAGASAEIIVAAVKADAAKEEARREARRESNRVRQARFRERNASNAMSRVTERDECDVTRDPTPLLSPLSSAPTPPTNNPPYNPPTDIHSLPLEAHSHTIDAQAPKRAQGRSLPDDWAPNDKHHAEAETLGRDDAWLAKQAEAMRTWALSNRNRQVARKADWDLTFLGWIRREHEKNPVAQPRASPSWAPVDTKGALERAMAKAGVRQ